MGTSLCRFSTCCERQDHPHAYGDKSVQTSIQVLTIGSSPRVWGQETGCQDLEKTWRIIPTRMGTSRFQSLFWQRVRDHPHAYGDKELFKGDENYHEGSSPRVWGQARPAEMSGRKRGIIPTRMGTSTGIMRLWSKAEDHPHAYGDK